MEKVKSSKIDQYRKYVQKVIQDYTRFSTMYEDTELETIFDTERNHYQLVQTGWHDNLRQYGCIMHLDIKETGRIWIQHDDTERGIANDLLDLGIPKEDIVLAFHAPYKRPYTGFAVE